MMKKKIFTMVAALVLSQCLMACGGSSESYSDVASSVSEAAVEEYYPTDNMIMQTEDGADSSIAAEETQRKLIRTVYLNVETKEYDSLLVNLDAQIKEFGGYVEDMTAYNGNLEYDFKNSRNASFKIRIPASSLDVFLKQVGEQVNIVERSESVEDVTLQYVDMDSHVRMLQEEQDRLLEFLSQATSIEEIISIEARLSEVKYQIESMNSQLRTMDNQVDYATVNIDIYEVVELTPVKELTVGERIADGFTDSVENVKEGIVEFFIWFVSSTPYLVVWAIIAVIAYVIIRIAMKISKKNSEKYEAKRRERMMNSPAGQKAMEVQMKKDGVFFERPNNQTDRNDTELK